MRRVILICQHYIIYLKKNTFDPVLEALPPQTLDALLEDSSPCGSGPVPVPNFLFRFFFVVVVVVDGAGATTTSSFLSLVSGGPFPVAFAFPVETEVVG